MTPNQAHRSFARHTRKWGQDVVIEWADIASDGTIDPVHGGISGATSPTHKTITKKASVHMVTYESNIRQFSEVNKGDAIIAFPYRFYKIIDPGTTGFTSGDIVDEFELASANENAATVAVSNESNLENLNNLHFEFSGKLWTRKSVGTNLSNIWDALVGGIKFTNVILVECTGGIPVGYILGENGEVLIKETGEKIKKES